MEGWVVFCWGPGIKRLLTQHHIYCKPMLVYILVLAWDIDFKFIKLYSGSYQKLPDISRNHRKITKNSTLLLEITKNGQKSPIMTGNCRKWPDIAKDQYLSITLYWRYWVYLMLYVLFQQITLRFKTCRKSTIMTRNKLKRPRNCRKPIFFHKFVLDW